MGSEKRGDVKRSALLEAAAELVLERGIAATTTRDVADRAGSTERTLFKQFGSKEGLVAEVLEKVALAQLDAAPFVVMREEPPRTLAAFQAWHRDLMIERMATLGAGRDVGPLFLMEILRNPALKARFGVPWRQNFWKPLVACLIGLQEKGEIAADMPAETLARTFITLQLGYLLARLGIAPQLDWDTARDGMELAELFRRTVRSA